MSYDPIIHFYDDPGHPYWSNNMASIKAEIMAIATEHGYTGAAPKTIAGAIDALADTLAGTDVEGKRTIAGAVKALAPYIGSGGGSGAELGTGYSLKTDKAAAVFASDQPLDSSLDDFGAKLAVGINANAKGQMMPAGLYVAMVIPNATTEPMVSGVDATIDGPSGSTSAYTVYFKMPSNAVSITATK